MKKLYIPTTTRNFNNIFSSESISPKSYYSKRNFGYKSYFEVEPNHLENSITLYDKLPIFTIDQNEYDDYPLIIEVEKEELAGVKQVEAHDGVTIFQSSQTIYLNPLTSSIYFFEDEHKKIALSKATSSLETKTVELYGNRFNIFNKQQVESFQWDEMYKMKISDKMDDNVIQKQISRDESMDRIKGFAYAYVIGANRSLSENIVCLKKQSRTFHDIISAVSNSPERYANSRQVEELKFAIREFEGNNTAHVHNKIISDFKDCATITDNGKFIETLRKYAKQAYLEGDFPVRNLMIKIEQELDKEEGDILIRAIEDHVDGIEKEYLNCKRKLICADAFAIVNCKLTSFSDEFDERQQYFYRTIINEVFLSPEFRGKDLNAQRLDLATNATLKIKSCIEEAGENWEEHKAREYLNNLRKNIGGEDVPFEIKWNHGVLPALAAIILKGDDPEKLEDCLIANKIYDYRLAFGFYGALFGFAKMPKTLTNSLLLSGDWDYIDDVYKYVYKQMYGIELKGNLKVTEPDKHKSTPIIETNQPVNTRNGNNSQVDELYADLEKECPSIKKDKTKYLNHINEYGKVPQLIKAIKEDSQLNNGKGAPQKVIDFLKKCIEEPKSRKKTNQAERPSLPFIQRCFYSDRGIFSHIEYLLPDECKKQFKDDLDWFQENHNETYDDPKKGEQEGFYLGKPKDNTATIGRFETYLNNKKYHREQDWLRARYSQVDIDKIISKLNELYL